MMDKGLLKISLLFVISLSFLIFIYFSFPPLEQEEKAAIKLPTNLDDAKILGRVLSKYKENHYYAILGFIVVTYIFLQSFAIPGSVFLSILCGYLFPFFTALSLICFCSSVGASVCYFLSRTFGRQFVQRYFPDRLKDWSSKVEENAHHMLFYIIFLRITPIFPNWLINIASPFVDVPFPAFFFGTFIGVAPPSLLFIETGLSLNELLMMENPFTFKRIAFITTLGTNDNDMNSSDNNENNSNSSIQEELYFVAELQGVFDMNHLNQIVNTSQCQIDYLDEENLALRMGNTVFSCHWEEVTGTDLILKFVKEVYPKSWKFVASSEKRLICLPKALLPEKEDSVSNLQENEVPHNKANNEI
ncbi:Transmembrane protein 41 -like protein [Trichinella nativa]|uniref:Transmembrane protein 41-like protein n=1 Tax=Trichinella nativa TaxID=6335 RepID=A0A0V1L8N8_9BILA|nr:Transmembrane protein 41 -like protein [Trichinella sp. T6]KRZ55875.1 Transmembrane protein 41 -like protein [Trichinella nativa]